MLIECRNRKPGSGVRHGSSWPDRGIPVAGTHTVIERLLCLLASDSDLVPARICGLLAQRKVATGRIGLSRLAATGQWWVQIVVRVSSGGEVQRIIDLLGRLVDVHTVFDATTDPMGRSESVVVQVRTATSRSAEIAELASRYSAEVWHSDPTGATLRLSAGPSDCQEFLGLLAGCGDVGTLLTERIATRRTGADRSG